MTDPRIPRLIADYWRHHDGLLIDFPELADDAQTLKDTLEGLTNAGDFIAYWCRKAREDEAFAKAISSMKLDMALRQERYEARAQRERDLAMTLLEGIGEKKITLPDMTITVNAGRQKVVVTDENALPNAYVRIKREPNKLAILEALESGAGIPGAELSNRTSTLTIRTK
jgi:hypothetical protein